ncbi:MAG: hypothetical protein VX694_02220 [Planctomycetota bacterium]|nr:hypothetical protein [Planctomycetota bacterium]MEC7678058.1 hypothetical protein [Planctomycetota bacterium]
MLSQKRWILIPALVVASVAFSGSQEAKADVRVSPTWGGISITFGNQARNCRPSYNSFFRSSIVQRHVSPFYRPSYPRYRSYRQPTYLRSRGRATCNPRFRR